MERMERMGTNVAVNPADIEIIAVFKSAGVPATLVLVYTVEKR